MSKLPSEIRLQIARNSKDSVWKIDELLNVIKIEVEVREASEMTKTSEDRKSPQALGHSKRERERELIKKRELQNQMCLLSNRALFCLMRCC